MGTGHFQDTVIRNGHPVTIPSQVLYNTFRTAKSLLGIDHPIWRCDTLIMPAIPLIDEMLASRISIDLLTFIFILSDNLWPAPLVISIAKFDSSLLALSVRLA